MCLCEDGFPAIACTDHAANECEECNNTGFTLNVETKACIVNVCTCVNGTPHSGQDCEDHNSEDCFECQGNFHEEILTDLDSRFIGTQDLLAQKTICLPNKCTCKNGIPVDDDDCILHESNQCKECNNPGTTDAYRFNPENESCENVCICFNGQAKVGSSCEAHRSLDCLECDENYYINEYGYVSRMKCEPNRCNCENGVEVDEGYCIIVDLFLKCLRIAVINCTNFAVFYL